MFGGGFGSQPAATSAPAAGGFTFGTPAAATPQQGSGLNVFAGNPSQPSLFGGNPASTAAPSTGLSFGAPAASIAAPGAFSFGATAPTTSTPGAFSLGGAAPTTTTAGGGFTFGAPATSAPAAGASLFGSTATSQPAAGGGFFGSTPAATTAGGAGLFGQSTAAPAGGFGFGSTAPAAAGATTAGAQAVTAISLQSKYSELPDNIRQGIDQMEKLITDTMHLSEHIANDEGIAKVTHTTHKETLRMEQELKGLRNLLDRDRNSIENVRKDLSTELRHADQAHRFVERVKTAGHGKPTSTYDVLTEYFLRITNDMETRMRLYRQNIEELEASVRNAYEQSQFSPEVLQDTMKNQDRAFKSIARDVAAVHDAVEEQKKIFTEYKRKYLNEDVGSGWKRERDNDSNLAELSAKFLRKSTSIPPQGQAPAPSGGLGGGGFGTLGATPAQTPAAGGGFGASTGGFGASTGGFGASTGAGLFGSQTPAAGGTTGLFGGGFGTAMSAKKQKPKPVGINTGGF